MYYKFFGAILLIVLMPNNSFQYPNILSKRDDKFLMAKKKKKKL